MRPAAPSTSRPAGWVRPALRNIGMMVLVMGGVLGLGAGAMAAWSAGHPTYQDVVLAPAQQHLQHDVASVQQAQAAAKAGDFAQAKNLLVEVRANESAFLEQVILAQAPQAPQLREVHEALKVFYGTLGGSLAQAIQCLDDLQSGQSPSASPACIASKAALQRAPLEAQALVERLVAIQHQLES